MQYGAIQMTMQLGSCSGVLANGLEQCREQHLIPPDSVNL